MRLWRDFWYAFMGENRINGQQVWTNLYKIKEKNTTVSAMYRLNIFTDGSNTYAILN